MTGDSYWELVEQIATRRKGEEVFNDSTAHASVLIERMFAHANISMCVFSRGLDKGVYDRDAVLSEVGKFLADSSRKLKVLVENGDLAHYEDSKFFGEVRGLPNVKLHVVDPDYIQGLKMNFTIMDNDCFRIEPDKNSHEAIAVFGDSKTGERYLKFFDELWSKSELLDGDDACAEVD